MESLEPEAQRTMAGCLAGFSVTRCVGRLVIRYLCLGVNRVGGERMLVVRSWLGVKDRRQQMQQGDENREQGRDECRPQSDPKPQSPNRSCHNLGTIPDGGDVAKADHACDTARDAATPNFLQTDGFPVPPR